jgi:glucose-1-phosphate thymidylyltransferase
VKGIILHGGAGTRLRPLTYSGPKQLIPIANKPVSQYALEDLILAGIKDIAIVLGETFPELVREHYGDGSRFGAHITYIYQGFPKGIAHAIGLCKDFIGDDKFVVYLGDNILQNGIKEYAREFINNNYDAMVLLKEVDDPKSFGVAEFDKSGKLIRFVEKPKVPPSNYALIGVYFLSPVVFRIIKELKPSWRGEYEITDTLQMLLERNYNVGYRIVKGWWFDTGKKDDILKVNALVLDERMQRRIEGGVINSEVEGRVFIDKNTKVINSTIRGPVIIGKECHIQNAFIGPFTSIGDGVKIINSGIEYSIIMNGAIIENVERIEDSLIGKNAKILKKEGRKAYRFNITNHSEVIL